MLRYLIRLRCKRQQLQQIERVCERVEGGIYKRLDEHRELYSLIQSQAPDLLAGHPEIIGWFVSQDSFLQQLASAANVQHPMIKNRPGQFPRSQSHGICQNRAPYGRG